ncbi:MAG: mechanosensitive ion channel family protein [Hyphomonadaceae bacterium]
MIENQFAFIDQYIAKLGPMGLAANAGLSVLLILAAAVASFLLSLGLRLLFRRIAARVEQARSSPPRAVRAVAGLLHLAFWATALMLALNVWGVDTLTWALGPGAPLISGAARILLVIVVAVVCWEGAIVAIEAAFRSAAARAETARRAAQLRSLGPMTRGAVRTLIAVFAALVIASQLGVEIGPLLAGAGVVGIAVGFGAQTLVKDYLTGFSLILEDIVSVGDIVRIGESAGLVETMALRTIRLRDFDGTLHVIPYSEAQTVHNLTKSFSYYVFNLPISYDSDIDAALALMRTVGEKLQSEPAFKKLILEPIEVVGVDQLADSGVVLKARIKTAPIEQWSVGREYNRRIKLAFDKAGIEIPVPHVKLLLSDRALEAVRATGSGARAEKAAKV